ncbi:hypothetical protein QA612_00370 [Evansella sp. AB-P1]|uniref:hypothetical protein n=1 Tax=Evansella sp. AB-P1 TaxID=3037653 RepID=UPI00241E1452|nr:hypothetical protein [Evansella sp. AB-P1]MDG5785924.1 hypothetical protein [Evansella sp. AB-P1]
MLGISSFCCFAVVNEPANWEKQVCRKIEGVLWACKWRKSGLQEDRRPPISLQIGNSKFAGR